MSESIVLKVCEALYNDVGKAIARVDTEELQRMGASIGDIIEIKGKGIALARVIPCCAEQSGRKIIQMDGILRENAGAGIDEGVSVCLATTQNAKNIKLSSSGKGSVAHSSEDIKYISHMLSGIPIVKGNRLRVKMLGYSNNDYTVTSTEPDGAVVIGTATHISIDNKAVATKDTKVSYEDIGGLQKQVQRVREMIELPLKFPEVFSRLGIEAPKGVLLYGPPGTGKTLIARAVANETDTFFMHINGPEIVHKFYGESEAKLRGIFETASKNAPSIIFLDEIDAIAPKREDVTGEVEKRIVAQLLALMDGLENRGQVIVIAATNIPNSLDPALRRPGRFDREIEIGIPDRNDRKQILQIHMRGMPLDEDVDIEKLADITHGFVGADLQALCREAAMTALRKIFPQIDFSNSSIPHEILIELKICMDDFYVSLQEIEPSAIREVFVDIPNVSFEDIGGLESIKEDIEKAIVWPQKYSSLYKDFGCKPPKGILFYGAPGTGKTLMAKAIASLNNANFISIKGPELLSKWVGESEKGLREIFKKAKQAAPCVIFFDEIDSLIPTRGNGNDVTERLICQMLTEIDGIEDLKGVMVLGATNRIDIVDKALLRPGRFDMLVEFKLPIHSERLEIFKIHMNANLVGADVDVEKLAEMTDGMTGADIMEICQRAALSGLTDYIARIEKTPDYEPVISMEHYKNVIKFYKSR